MTKEEVKGIMEKIKGYYPLFDLSDKYIVKEWQSRLEPFEAQDVYKRIERHLSGDKSNLPPSLNWMSMSLKTPEQKVRENHNLTICRVCHQSVLYADYMEHFNRCSSVDYLNRRNNDYFGKDIDKYKYMTMNDEEFQEKYDTFCKYIYQNTKDPNEKYYLKMYFETM